MRARCFEGAYKLLRLLFVGGNSVVAVLQCVAVLGSVCGSALQCVAVCCSVWQCLSCALSEGSSQNSASAHRWSKGCYCSVTVRSSVW